MIRPGRKIEWNKEWQPTEAAAGGWEAGSESSSTRGNSGSALFQSNVENQTVRGLFLPSLGKLKEEKTRGKESTLKWDSAVNLTVVIPLVHRTSVLEEILTWCV